MPKAHSPSRHQNYYTEKARRENYAARSVYKLQEIDRRENLLTRSRWVLDLGAAPGSWSQYCLAHSEKTRVIGVDIAPCHIANDRFEFWQMGIESDEFSEKIGTLPISKFCLVLSDMAPKTTGIHSMDVVRSLELSTMALHVACRLLKDDGAAVIKVFMGEGFEEFHEEAKGRFQKVRLLRPETTRKRSREIYLIGRQLRPLS